MSGLADAALWWLVSDMPGILSFPLLPNSHDSETIAGHIRLLQTIREKMQTFLKKLD